MRDLLYEDYKQLVEEHLMDFLPEVDTKSATVYDAMKYSITAGGKRLRPILLLAACEFAGGKCETALPYACAIEYMHTYSLIHDDLPCMDDDDLRRGLATNHKVFGEAIATLAGDGLQSAAMEAMSRDKLLYLDNIEELKKRVNASYEIIKGAGCRGMIAGQTADIESEGRNCSKEMLEYIHLTKTAALIVAAVRAGARLGGASNEVLSDLTVFAENLGLAFQIADDILDVQGSEEEMGKKPGQDDYKHKSTYPSLFGMEASKERLNELTAAAVGALSKYYDNAEFFVKIAVDFAVRVR